MKLARCAVYAFLEPLPVLQRLHDAFYASYFVTGWEMDSRSRFELRNEFITANQRDCIHLNAKSLLLYLWWIVSQPVLRKHAPFAAHGFGEQQCEQIYRIIRDSSGADTNFTLFDMQYRLGRAQLAEMIRLRRKNDFFWPQHRKHPALEKLSRAAEMLPDSLSAADLQRTVEEARRDALADLELIGIKVAQLQVPQPAASDNSEDDNILAASEEDIWLDGILVSTRDALANDHDDDDGEVEACEADETNLEPDDNNSLAHDSANRPAADSQREPFASRPDQIVPCRTSPTLRDLSGSVIHKQKAAAYVSRHQKLSNDRRQRYRTATSSSALQETGV